MLEALLALKIFKFCSDCFGFFNFKKYDVTDGETNNCSTNIAQYLKKLR